MSAQFAFISKRSADARPHTVHANTSPTFSTAPGFSTVPHGTDADPEVRGHDFVTSPFPPAPNKTLPRDDTHRDMPTLASRPPEDEQPYPGYATQISQTNGIANPFHQWRRQHGGTGGSTYAGAAEVSAQAPSYLKQTRGIGRRFSRKYSEKIAEVRDGFHRHGIPGRRRASTPQETQTIDPRLLLQPTQPTSPTKRTANRSVEPRPRKHGRIVLPNFLNDRDRRDTPAPAATASASGSRPMQAPSALGAAPPVLHGWTHGGEGARKAAAAANSVPAGYAGSFLANAQDLEDLDVHQEGLALRNRRSQIGSMNSAADSGADLSNDFEQATSPASSEDHDSVMGGTVDEEEVAIPVPRTRDPLCHLPDEIALHIFELLDANDLACAQAVSKRWHVMTQEDSVWRHAYMRRFQRQTYTDPPPVLVGGAGEGRYNKPKQEWKRMYKARLMLDANWRKGPVEAGKAIYLSGHTDSVYCLQFDEEKIITGSRDRTIRVWDINTFQCIKVIGGPNVRPTAGPKVLRTVDYPSFHLATASVNGTPYGDMIYTTPREWHDASILCLQYDDEILVTGSSDSDLLVWDVKTYEPIKRLRRHTGGVLDVALDAKHIVSCSKDSRIIVWDRQTFESKGELTGHRGPVNAVQLRGKYLVSASGDGIARLWDLEQMKLVKQFNAKERGLAAVEFSEDMRYVLAGGNDHITYKFDVETGEEVMQFTGHTQLVRSLWLDSANKRVVSGSYDLDLRVYDFDTGEEIWRAEEWTTSWMLAAKSDYRRIVATSQDGRILVVDFGLKKGGYRDGDPIDGVDLLRGIEHTNAIQWRNPWHPSGSME